MAFIEYYVSSSASGSDDGLSAGAPFTLSQALSDATAGRRYNIKADGTYARTTTADAPVAGGTISAPIVFRGYNTTPGDGNQGYGSDGLIDVSNMPVITYTTGAFSSASIDGIVLESLNITVSNNTDYAARFDNDSAILNCKITNTTAASLGVRLDTGGAIIDSEIDVTGAGSVEAVTFVGSAITRILGGRIRCVGGSAIVINSEAVVLADCVIHGSAIGVEMENSPATPLVANNVTFYDCTKAFEYINAAPANGYPVIRNCSITDCGEQFDNLYVGTADVAVIQEYMRTRNNSAGDTGVLVVGGNNGVATAGAASVDYTNAGSLDFRPVSDSPLVDAGPRLNDDIGAMNHTPGGGGSPNRGILTGCRL